MRRRPRVENKVNHLCAQSSTSFDASNPMVHLPILVLALGLLGQYASAALELSNIDPSVSFFEHFLQFKRENVDPVKAALTRPTVGVLVVVDGESPDPYHEWTPFWAGLNKRESEEKSVKQILQEQRVRELGALGGNAFRLGLSSWVDDENSEVYKYYQLKGNEQVEPLLTVQKHESSRTHLVVVDDSSKRLSSELALLERLTRDALDDKAARPALVVMVVHGLENRQSQSRAQSLDLLGKRLEGVISLMQQSTARPVYTIVFTERRAGAVPKVISETQGLNSQQQPITTARKLQSVPFQGSDYVLMFWVMVVLIFITYFVFACIPWAPELDPVLKSVLKQDTKRD